MNKILDRDWNTKVYRERSKLTSHDAERKIRLNPLHLVKRDLDNDRVPTIILKPLVETQNSLKLLSYFTDSKALWIYRHYKDVACSNLKYFGTACGLRDLRPIVENSRQNWRSESIPKEIRDMILELFSENMEPLDAAALFWFSPQQLFFQIKFG